MNFYISILILYCFCFAERFCSAFLIQAKNNFLFSVIFVFKFINKNVNLSLHYLKHRLVSFIIYSIKSNSNFSKLNPSKYSVFYSISFGYYFTLVKNIIFLLFLHGTPINTHTYLRLFKINSSVFFIYLFF